MDNPTVVRVYGVKGIELFIQRAVSQDLVKEWLEEFNMDFNINRGDDPEYKFAQLGRSSVLKAEKFNLDTDDVHGWEVRMPDLKDTDYYDYLYILHSDGTVSEA